MEVIFKVFGNAQPGNSINVNRLQPVVNLRYKLRQISINFYSYILLQLYSFRDINLEAKKEQKRLRGEFC